MKKGVMEIPAECEICKAIYDLNEEFIGEDWNKTISEVLIDKYGHDKFICYKCRKGARVLEKGEYNLVTEFDGEKQVVKLELNSDLGRKIMVLD